MKKFLKILLCSFLVLALLAGGVFAVMKISGNHRSDPAKILQYETSNPFITGSTRVIAHRGGAGIAPEETLLALRTGVEDPDISVDIFEFDLRITKDHQLVLFHDAGLDRTTDAEAVFGAAGLLVRDLTLAELRQLNMGAKFTDSLGNMPYAQLETVPDDLRILTLAEALDYLTAAGDFRYSIEVKDDGEPGKRAVDLLYAELAQRDLLGCTIFSSFKTAVSSYADATYPDLIRSNTDAEAVAFYLAALTGDEDYIPPCSVFQLPFTDKYLNLGINFATARVINYAHSRNIALQYWTVNAPERMEYLASVGVDGIMSDFPDVLCNVIGDEP